MWIRHLFYLMVTNMHIVFHSVPSLWRYDNNYGKPVLSDHIFLAYQTGVYLLLHESSTESSC